MQNSGWRAWARRFRGFQEEGAISPRVLSLAWLWRRCVLGPGAGPTRSRDPCSWRRRQQRCWRLSETGAGSCSRGVDPRQSVPPSAPSLVFRSVAGGAGMAERGLESAPAAVAALPPEVRAQLAELELELSEGRSRAGERAPRRRCDSRRQRDQVSAARPGGRAGERGGGCRKSGRGCEGSSSLLSHPVKWLSPVVHCALGEGVKQRLGGDILPGPRLLLRSLVPKTRDKAAPSVSFGASGHGGGGVRLRAGWLTAFSCSLRFSRGGPHAYFSPPPPFLKKRKTHGKSAALLLPPLTMRDVSLVTGVR